MLVYPQLASGALTQFPIQKQRRLRTVANTLGDGRTIKLADPSGENTGWRLTYTGLSDQEASALEVFFEATEGSLLVFTFLDPTSNLLAWSDHLDHAAWSKGPLLTVTGGLTDPAGGTNGWHLSNAGAAEQALTQILEAPGAYIYCFSAYARASGGGAAVSLVRGPARREFRVANDWERIAFSGSAEPSAETVEFGVELPAGASLDIYGMQVEPQPVASAYKPSRFGGVYQNAAFRDDFLTITATDVNRHSATVDIIHAVRL